MKVSLVAPLVSPVNDAAYVSALAKGAEARGFHSIWLGEHVVLFDNYDAEYPYEENGKIPVGGDRGLLEPITALSFMAAQTSRIRLGTGICLVPQRNPVYTAKEIAGRLSVARARRLWGGRRMARRGVHRVGCALCPSRCPVPRVSGGDQVSLDG